MNHHRLSQLTLSLLILCGCQTRASKNELGHTSVRSDAARTHPTDRETSYAEGDASVLRINGENLTVTDLLKPITPDLKRLSQQMPMHRRERYLEGVLRTLLSNKIEETLLYQEASKDITEAMKPALDGYVDRELRSRINRNYGGRQTRFEEELAKSNLSIEDIREQLRREILIVNYQQQTLYPKIQNPTRQELWALYQGNLEDYTLPEKREMRLIEIRKDNDPNAASVSIRQAQERLLNGEPFAEVATSCSQGIKADQGGYWGYIQSPLQGRYEAVSDALYTLTAGQTSDIIKTPDSYFIVSAGNVVPKQQRQFTEVQPELIEDYRSARYQELQQEMMLTLHEHAIIEPNEEVFLAKLLDAALNL